MVVASLIFVIPAVHAECHWWQFRNCNQPDIKGLPDEAPRQGVVITVDVSRNRAYLFREGELVASGAAATGTEKMLEYGDDVWLFHTPRGHLKVLRRIVDPVWTKPDWAFIEAGEPIPPPDSPKRLVKGKLGKYALSLGEGILIHGTDDPRSLGTYASHGCIRLPNALLAKVWNLAKVGTDVYIFDSRPPAQTAERHSDLQ
jgi:L,D-transpeptidase ErfK/SrfK